MDREALAVTLRRGAATFLSHDQPTAVDQGGASGNVAEVVSISVDCDRDTLLLRVE